MNKTKKGFTLIELLIVIAIIGILAVAFLPSLLNAPAKGRDAQRTATIQKIENFLVTKMLAGQSLPVSDCIVSTGGADTIGKLIKDGLADFGGVFPVDPQSDNVTTGAVKVCTGQYGFVHFTNANKKYTAGVYARMENKENANVACGSIVGGDGPALTPGGGSLVDADLPCYITLIQ